jgi:5-methylcytosine-specific restriction endonuclease McrA
MLKKVMRIKLGKQIYRRLMKRVLERDGWRCRKCGSLKDLQVHHKIRRSQQGHDALGNLVTLCAYCHMAEHGQLCYAGDRTHQGIKGPEEGHPPPRPQDMNHLLTTQGFRELT